MQNILVLQFSLLWDDSKGKEANGKCHVFSQLKSLQLRHSEFNTTNKDLPLISVSNTLDVPVQGIESRTETSLLLDIKDNDSKTLYCQKTI